ncbi:hypothetical protein T439DRAFT_382745 [Meredithblackwellia eburnea MCA 4105]
MSSNNATILFATILGAIPPSSGIDPFFAISALFTKPFYVRTPESFKTQLYIICGLFAFFTLALAFSIFIRARRQGIWMFRITQSSVGSFITPHYAVSWQVLTLIFTILVIPNNLYTIKYSRGEDVPRYIVWKVLAWLPSWLAAWCAVWALWVAQSLPNPQEDKRPWWKSPKFINIHFVTGAILGVTITAALAIPPSINFDKSYTTLHQLQKELVVASSIYKGNSTASLWDALQGPQITAQKLLDHSNNYLFYFRIAWSVWVVVTLYVYTLFAMVAVSHFRRINIELTSLRELGHGSEGTGSSGERTRLISSWRDMVITAAFITLVGFDYTANCFWLAIKTETASRSPIALQVETVITMWGFALLGFPAILIILRRSVEVGGTPTVVALHDIKVSNSESQGTNGTTSANSPFSVRIDVNDINYNRWKQNGNNTFELELLQDQKSLHQRGTVGAEEDLSS